MTNPLKAKEYGKIEITDNNLFQCIMESLFSGANLSENAQHERLGVHKTADGYRALHYVGAIWLSHATQKDQRVPLIIYPKVHDETKILDAVAMLDKAVQYSEIFDASEKASQEPIFKIFEDQEYVTSNDSVPDISMFQVVWYLKELASFCQRSIRQGFIRIDDNLIGKIKGKILIDEQIHKNFSRGRADRMACRYEIMTVDTLPNRILKYALRLSTGLLNQKYGANNKAISNIWIWARQAESALSDVTLTTVKNKDFNTIHYSGSLSKYKSIHILAKAIISNLRIDASGSIQSTGSIIPFALNMNTLYEAYVGVKLKQAGIDLLPQQTMSVKFGNGTKTFRPDFCSPCGKLIIDAKYKRYIEGNNEERISADLEQLIAYSVLVPACIAKKANTVFNKARIPPNEHWAFLIVPSLEIDKEISFKTNENGFFVIPNHIGSLLEIQFPIEGNGKLKAGLVECPVPRMDNPYK